MDPHSHPGLILIEGLPGSGKSTLAHALIRRFAQQQVACRWWYEEEAGHPLYLFHDAASMQKVLDDLAAGDHQRIIDAVVEKWRSLAHEIAASGTIVILDSCLFGYLTWTLFPFDIPEEVTTAYLMGVEQISRVANPRLIYLYQDDVGGALRKICERRGGNTEQRFIRNATESVYGKRHGLRGFAGMVSFWQRYRAITDGAFARIGFPKLAIENAAGDWPAYECAAARFVGLPSVEVTETLVRDPERFVGHYCDHRADSEAVCQVRWVNNALLIDGLPMVWPENRLIPISANRFAVESFPFTVEFEDDGTGAIEAMIATGAALLSGAMERRFVRMRDESQRERTPDTAGLLK